LNKNQVSQAIRKEEIMVDLKDLKFKIKIKGLEDFRNKLDELSSEFEKLKNNMSKINDLVEEINKMELTVDVDREKEQ
jgi:hypothetical protein